MKPKNKLKGVTGIYKITNPEGKIYIGQSIDIGRRYAQQRLLHSWPSDNPLTKSMRTFGKNAHNIEVVEECDMLELNRLEVYYINKFNSIRPNGLNVNPGGYYKNGKLTTQIQKKWLKSHGFTMDLSLNPLENL